MVENTKIQMFKTKVYAMINKLDCLNCGKSDNTSKVSTHKLLCSKWCCQEQSSQYGKYCFSCPYSKKKGEDGGAAIGNSLAKIEVIQIPNKSCQDQPHRNCVDSTYKCCHWCSKSQ